MSIRLVEARKRVDGPSKVHFKGTFQSDLYPTQWSVWVRQKTYVDWASETTALKRICEVTPADAPRSWDCKSAPITRCGNERFAQEPTFSGSEQRLMRPRYLDDLNARASAAPRGIIAGGELGPEEDGRRHQWNRLAIKATRSMGPLPESKGAILSSSSNLGSTLKLRGSLPERANLRSRPGNRSPAAEIERARTRSHKPV